MHSKRGWFLVAAALAAWWGCGSDGTTNTTLGGSGGSGPGGSMPATGGGCAAEEKCNGVDDDCNGSVDEGCACIDGDEVDCYTGDPGTEGTGVCIGGVQTCDDSGVLGDCEGEVTPIAEVCNGSDDDCDGGTDEDFGTVTCGIGACQVTIEECVDGEAQVCIPGDPAPSEMCEGTDDDCDGDIDEGCLCLDGNTQPCYSGSPMSQNVGECHDGTQTCAGGQWGPCLGDVTPLPEVCDGLDNDCEGTPDQGDPGGGSMCSTGDPGVCDPGVFHCVGGQVSCVANVQPSAETCNMLDDDCNGTADDGNNGCGGVCPLANPIGMQCDGADTDVCTEGSWQCVGMNMESCSDQSGNNVEICDAIDQDCDSIVDEGPCSLANATSSCMGGGCALIDCDTGFCDLDLITPTGCEHDLDTNPSCPASATYIGAVSGDSGSANLVFNGRGERYLRFHVDENDSGFCSAENLCVQVQLNPNGAQMNYDLYAACDNCANSISSTLGSGQTDIVSLKWDEATIAGCPSGSNSGRDVYVFIQMTSVDECDTYTLTVIGDNCSAPNNTCSTI
jgi:putative metal-binding protein